MLREQIVCDFIMATANVPNYFLSSSEGEEEFWGFLPEEMNEGRPQRGDDSYVSVAEISSSEEDNHEVELERDEEEEGWSEQLSDIFISPFADETGGTFTLEGQAEEADFFLQDVPGNYL